MHSPMGVVIVVGCAKRYRDGIMEGLSDTMQQLRTAFLGGCAGLGHFNQDSRF